MRYLVLLLLVSCSGLEKSETEKVRKANAVQEPIYRLTSERYPPMSRGKKVVRARYPWETSIVGNFPRITKEFFRCKGSIAHPDRGKISDCGGIDQHSLPIKEGKEFTYPALLDLLNYVQATLKKRVVVTCGHRCPTHDHYSTLTQSKSKHMMGAEVDFYVEGSQEKPYEMIQAIMQYYHTSERTRDKLPYTHFSQTQSSLKNPSWMNREVIIRLYEKDEGRDWDNSHPYPYVSIELRHDYSSNRAIHYNWVEANHPLLKR